MKFSLLAKFSALYKRAKGSKVASPAPNVRMSSERGMQFTPQQLEAIQSQG